MAKYTQLYYEYVNNGGIIPPLFDTIPHLDSDSTSDNTFTKLFYGRYCDRELGFETPELFAIKFQARAALWIPLYKAKIEAYNAFYNTGLTSIRSTLSDTTTFGKVVTVARDETMKAYTNPVYIQTPSSTSTLPDESLTDIDTTDNDSTSTDSGTEAHSISESPNANLIAEYKKQYFNQKLNLYNELLDKFDTLFFQEL